MNSCCQKRTKKSDLLSSFSRVQPITTMAAGWLMHPAFLLLLLGLGVDLQVESNEGQDDGIYVLNTRLKRESKTSQKLGPTFHIEPPNELFFSNDTGNE